VPVHVRARQGGAAVVAAVVLLASAQGVSLGAAAQLDAAREARERLQAQAAQAAEELELLGERLAEASQARATLEQDVAQLEADAAAAAEALMTRAVAAFKHGVADDVQLLLGAEAPLEAVARARLLESLGRHERELVERAAAARLALASRRVELDVLLVSLRADEARAAELRAALDAAFADAQARETELVSRSARQRRLDRPRQRGVYACPMAVPYHFRDTWGHPRSGGRRHKGTDMYAPMGGAVYAITGGVVARHSLSRLGGLGLYLRGDDGNLYYYAHLQRMAAAVGRRVEAGELVAYNGDTGNARGGAPHVHFEVRPGGAAPINPYPFAAASCY
jgi:murein DD-endopeptidase MepM/ murein hydrolase activator NlpD